MVRRVRARIGRRSAIGGTGITGRIGLTDIDRYFTHRSGEGVKNFAKFAGVLRAATYWIMAADLDFDFAPA